MSDDGLDWKKNVRPIKCGRVALKVDHKVDVKSMVNKGTFDLQEKFLSTNNISLSFCLDYNTKSKVDKGKYFISDRLDLHGYNIEGAYCKLIDFIIKNYQAGSRCLLVITGQSNATGKEDTIKSNLNRWLSDTKVRHMILYSQRATEKHGSKGAFYVLLRRNKNFVL
ncbi:DNA mismatch repair protein MutS [Wolbachia endosymbiont of Litomosoides brasiliensis]|uniref:Smr/MutS family protein n=1 Tax=Wolbachia endosymbiont of Litomosoides brasiliensis TaxID=1812117 RepID=UPI00158A89F5|nr:DNA mismatch repair protein MutS [Wolbachia endosymbiont of Litomosoides brasiliensis]